MNKSKAYKIVYNDLISKDNTSLFRGNYDAVNGSAEFMNGIHMVIENIAFHVDENTQYNFDSMFTHNMVLSRKMAEHILYNKSFKYRFKKNLNVIKNKVFKFIKGVLK